MTSCTRVLVSLALLAAAVPATWTEPGRAEAAGRRCFGREATIVGTPGPDEITVRAGSQVIVGLGGNDVIKVGRGVWGFYVCAGAGNDTVITGRNLNHVRGGRGDDRLISRTDYDELPTNRFFGGPGDDRLVGAEGTDHMIPGPGNDYITDRSDPLRSNNRDTLDLSSARRGLRLSSQRHVVRGQGRDRFFRMETVIGSDHDDMIIGDEDREIFYGGAGDDVLRGKGGNDRLIGGTGADKVAGGGGDDMTAEAPASLEPEDDILEGGRGYDWVSYSGYGTESDAGVRVDLRKGSATSASGTDALTGFEGAVGTGGMDVLIGDDGENNLMDSLGDDEVYGNGGDDVLGEPNDRGTSAGWAFEGSGDGDDLIEGGEGNDLIRGGPGDDRLLGGAGDDSIVATDREFRVGREEEYTDHVDGGAGKDEISYEHSEVAVVVDLLAGFAQDQEGTDTLVAIENIRGSLSYDDRLTGDDGENSIYGGGGDDLLDGSAGFDRLFGGPDQDTCVNGEELSGCEL